MSATGVAYGDFRAALSTGEPKAFQRLRAPGTTWTSQLQSRAAKEGELAALMWMRAICPQTFYLQNQDLMYTAAQFGHSPYVQLSLVQGLTTTRGAVKIL